MIHKLLCRMMILMTIILIAPHAISNGAKINREAFNLPSGVPKNVIPEKSVACYRAHDYFYASERQRKGVGEPSTMRFRRRPPPPPFSKPQKPLPPELRPPTKLDPVRMAPQYPVPTPTGHRTNSDSPPPPKISIPSNTDSRPPPPPPFSEPENPLPPELRPPIKLDPVQIAPQYPVPPPTGHRTNSYSPPPPKIKIPPNTGLRKMRANAVPKTLLTHPRQY